MYAFKKGRNCPYVHQQRIETGLTSYSGESGDVWSGAHLLHLSPEEISRGWRRQPRAWLTTHYGLAPRHRPLLDFPKRLSLSYRRSHFTTATYAIHNWSGKYAHLSIYGLTDKIEVEPILTLSLKNKIDFSAFLVYFWRQTISIFFDNFLGEYIMRTSKDDLHPFLMEHTEYIDCWKIASAASGFRFTISPHLFLLLILLSRL